MAGDGAKRRLEQNQKRLAALRAAALASTLVYAGARLALNRGGGSKGLHWAGLVVTLLAHGFAYLAIAAVARPTYSNSGALVDGGGDLDKGSASMYHDLLYITCAVQVLAAFTDKAWWLYAAIPAYGAYKLWTGILYPEFKKAAQSGGGAREAPVDPKERARLERADQRAQRRRVKRF